MITKLKPCPDTPNCVSSEAEIKDKQHYVEPFSYSTSKKSAKEKLISVLKSYKKSKIIINEENYICTEFKIFIYIDKVEFLFLEQEKIIHIRSASKVGKWDLGINRRRVKKLRKLF